MKNSITSDITYIYTIFVFNSREKDVVSAMKNGILPEDNEFVELTQGPNQRRLAQKSFQDPYDILMAKLKDRIVDFYSDIQLSGQARRQLDQYGSRANVYKEQFEQSLDSSMKATAKAVLKEMDLQILQGKDVKSTIKSIRRVLKSRTQSVQKLLEASAGQMQRYMVLWNYQNQGYDRYKFITTGVNCEVCSALDGETFSISDACIGVNLAPLHPNCDCSAGILDENGDIVHMLEDELTSSHSEDESQALDYLRKSINQVLLGNYSDDATLLGTAGQIGLGLAGLDLPADIRDLAYDLTNWKWTWGHAGQTALDMAALLPVIGTLKYTDEAGALIKGAAKYGDEAAEALDSLKGTGKQVDDVIEGAGKANPKGIKINVGKQDKHIPGTNNYKQSIANGANRSTLAKNPQQLLDDFAGTGQKIGANKERVDFGKVIGQYYDESTGTFVDTTRGIIHYDSKGGAHIVPSAPR